jgi:hypothetical protein
LIAGSISRFWKKDIVINVANYSGPMSQLQDIGSLSKRETWLTGIEVMQNWRGIEISYKLIFSLILDGYPRKKHPSPWLTGFDLDGDKHHW